MSPTTTSPGQPAYPSVPLTAATSASPSGMSSARSPGDTADEPRPITEAGSFFGNPPSGHPAPLAAGTAPRPGEAPRSRQEAERNLEAVSKACAICPVALRCPMDVCRFWRMHSAADEVLGIGLAGS